MSIKPGHKKVCVDQLDSWGKLSRTEGLKILLFKKTKNPSSPIEHDFQWSSILTDIFLSSALAERCKINFGKFWVEVVWLPEGWAGRGQVPWLYLCSWGGRRGHPSCQPLGVTGGLHGLCVSAPRWERQCSLGRVVWNRAAVNHGPPSLSCPWRLVFQQPSKDQGVDIAKN